jgi:hypothetical protein
MKKLICILAGAALLGACEQKTEVVTPASSPAPDAAATGQKPKREIKNSLSAVTTPGAITESKAESIETTNTLSAAATPAVSTETKTESTDSTTTTTATTPNP